MSTDAFASIHKELTLRNEEIRVLTSKFLEQRVELAQARKALETPKSEEIEGLEFTIRCLKASLEATEKVAVEIERDRFEQTKELEKRINELVNREREQQEKIATLEERIKQLEQSSATENETERRRDGARWLESFRAKYREREAARLAQEKVLPDDELDGELDVTQNDVEEEENEEQAVEEEKASDPVVEEEKKEDAEEVKEEEEEEQVAEEVKASDLVVEEKEVKDAEEEEKKEETLTSTATSLLKTSFCDNGAKKEEIVDISDKEDEDVDDEEDYDDEEEEDEEETDDDEEETDDDEEETEDEGEETDDDDEEETDDDEEEEEQTEDDDEEEEEQTEDDDEEEEDDEEDEDDEEEEDDGSKLTFSNIVRNFFSS